MCYFENSNPAGFEQPGAGTAKGWSMKMKSEHLLSVLGLATLLAASPASAQIVSGVMTVTGAEMH